VCQTIIVLGGHGGKKHRSTLFMIHYVVVLMIFQALNCLSTENRSTFALAERHYSMLLPVLERIMKAHTTESEKTGNKVFSVYISIASVKENRARSSAQFRSLSASAAYKALP